MSPALDTPPPMTKSGDQLRWLLRQVPCQDTRRTVLRSRLLLYLRLSPHQIRSSQRFHHLWHAGSIIFGQTSVGQTGNSSSGCILLQTALVLTAASLCLSIFNMDMSDFTAGTVGTGQDSAVDDDTSTDTGSQVTATRLNSSLPPPCHISPRAATLASFPASQLQADPVLFQGLCQIKGTPANVHCTVDHIAVGVHCTGSSNSYAYQFFYRDILLPAFCFDRCCNIRQYLFPPLSLLWESPLIQHLSLYH